LEEENKKMKEQLKLDWAEIYIQIAVSNQNATVRVGTDCFKFVEYPKKEENP
jgi:hypothetical protein